MNKKPIISIIIPQYNETEEQVTTLFEMLNSQLNVDFNDFEVILVNDHSETRISADFLSKFGNLHIKNLQTPENVGAGMCRQYGYDNSDSEYVWFIDADDTIFNLLAVSNVLTTIENDPDADIIQAKFLQEMFSKELGQMLYIRNDGVTWLHSKIYKRKFLNKYNVRFPEGFRYSEDSYFNTVAYNLDSKISGLDEILTVWRANPNSLTRKDNYSLIITGYPDYIKTKTLILDKIKPYIDYNKYRTLAIQTICQFYFDKQKRDFDKFDADDLKKQIEMLILLFYANHQEELSKTSEAEFNEIYNDIREKFFKVTKVREKCTIEEFYQGLKEKYLKKNEKSSKNI